MDMQQATNQPSETRDLLLSRLINAPREVVWQAWTQPEHLKRWFAPEHFTTAAAKVDLRPGGNFLYCMRSPEGAEFWGKGVYREILAPERLVYHDTFADEDGHPVQPEQYGLSPDYPAETLVTVTLADQNGKTLLTLRHAGLPIGEGSDMTEAGWRTQLDRLAEALAA
jgi:uncharacterized protein YndB with AHSA1/START domain